MKKGFTLAEVLVTLGIIGVVAAMTIPALISNINHMQYSARLKKIYSTLKQALVSAEDDYGDVNSWDATLSYEDYFKTYFAPYIKGTISRTDDGTVRFLLSDGSYLSIFKGNCMDICFDANGYSKPNKIGYDQFKFLYCPAGFSWCNGEGGFCTYHNKYQTTREQRLAACKSDPQYCSSLLEMDNWKFEKDYPYLK